jgi:hypothetical protein
MFNCVTLRKIEIITSSGKTNITWLYLTNRVVENFSNSTRVYVNNELSALQKTCGTFVTVPFINYWKATERAGKP